jgi:benzoylsuccinyl-CoA thiolase BbsB subunit
MGQAAVVAAMADAGVSPGEINVAFCGSVYGGMGLGQRVLMDLGLLGIPIQNLENACASSAGAVVEATAWIRAGMADVALCFGLEQMSHPAPNAPSRGPLEVFAGGWVTVYGMRANERVAGGDLSVAQLAQVAVKNRGNASLNDKAQFQKPITLEEVLQSRKICEPLTLLQCCPPSDGAAALVIMSEGAVNRHGLMDQAVRIAGIAMGSGKLIDGNNSPTPHLVTRVADQAYERAGLGPRDLQVCEVHDAFTIGEIQQTEYLGLCGPGEGGGYVESGRSAIGGGGVAVNPGGGLLSRGHPLGATGAAQIAEVVDQLRRRVGPRQVEGARVGLTSAAGGSLYNLEANASVVTILVK